MLLLIKLQRFEWFAEFRGGRRSLNDEPRNGGPVEVITEDNDALVCAMVECSCTVRGNHRDLIQVHRAILFEKLVPSKFDTSSTQGG